MDLSLRALASLLLLALATLRSASASMDPQQLEALREINKAWNLDGWSEFWTPYLTPLGDPCTIPLLTCSPEGGPGTSRVVTSLQVIGHRDLAAAIPTWIGQLTDLVTLEVVSNPKMRSTLPTELGKLTNLHQFTIAGSDITGPIPTEIAALIHLESLDLSQLKLSGTIPDIFARMYALTTLDLQDNKLTGTLPPSFANVIDTMEELSLAGNRLEGPLPANMDVLAVSLKDCELSGTQVFDCPIPALCLRVSHCRNTQTNEVTELDAPETIEGAPAVFPLCKNVTCSALSPCHLPGLCSEDGHCTNPLAANGYECCPAVPDDEFPDCDVSVAPQQVIHFTCEGGQCIKKAHAPVDLCKDVVCSALSACHQAGTCSGGKCSSPPSPPGTPCCPPAAALEFDDEGCDVNDPNVPKRYFCEVDAASHVPQCELRVNNSFYAGVAADPCHGVSCSAASECHVTPKCKDGECPVTFAENGSPCSKGVCLSGECKDLCDPPPKCESRMCHLAATCVAGECHYGSPINGMVCPGGLCNDGACDLCANVKCEAKGECQASVCIDGKCTYPPVEDGLPCGQGVDKCRAGACLPVVIAPVDPCAAKSCDQPDACHTPGACREGSCVYPVAANGTKCPIGSCVSGVCVDACLVTTCSAKDSCHGAGTCSNGTCSQPELRNGLECADVNGGRCSRGVCIGCGSMKARKFCENLGCCWQDTGDHELCEPCGSALPPPAAAPAAVPAPAPATPAAPRPSAAPAPVAAGATTTATAAVPVAAPAPSGTTPVSTTATTAAATTTAATTAAAATAGPVNGTLSTLDSSDTSASTTALIVIGVLFVVVLVAYFLWRRCNAHRRSIRPYGGRQYTRAPIL